MVNEIDNDVTVLNEDLPKLFNTYVKWKLVLYSVPGISTLMYIAHRHENDQSKL